MSNNLDGKKPTAPRIALFALTLTLTWIMPALSMALVRVSNAALMAAATQMPKPAYPEIAKAAHAEGQVEIDVVVSSDGAVKDARPVSGNLMLRESARTAAMKWKFDPAKLHSEQDVIGTLVFDFKR